MRIAWELTEKWARTFVGHWCGKLVAVLVAWLLGIARSHFVCVMWFWPKLLGPMVPLSKKGKSSDLEKVKCLLQKECQDCLHKTPEKGCGKIVDELCDPRESGYVIARSHDPGLWCITWRMRSEHGNTGNSRSVRYKYCSIFILVLFSLYVSIIIIDLTLSCESVRLSLIQY